ncbi:MAG: hypothetical protein JWP02_3708 [Acidimicrobiales bacterium]|nr:hypothetical protein [Acidimicrobiales bacterium]
MVAGGLYRLRTLQRDRLAATAFALGVVAVGWHGWATLRGYFTQDDFLYTYRAAQHSLGLHYLLQPYSGVHLMPGQFLLVWLTTWIAPLNHVVAVLPILLIQALTVVLFWRVLVRLFARNELLLLPFAAFALSPLIFVSTLWWAFSLQLSPLLAALFGAVDQHVHYLQSGERRHALLALAWVAAGLLFWEKAALIVLVLFGISVALYPVGGLARRVIGAVVRSWWSWTCYAALGCAYAILYVSSAQGAPSGSAISVSQLFDTQALGLARRMIVDVFLPGVFGAPWNANLGKVNTPSPIVAAAAVVVVVAAVVTSVARRGRRAATAWLLLAAYLLCDVVLLAVTRLETFGQAIGSDPRFVADAVPIAALCGALAFLRLKHEPKPPTPPPRSAPPWTSNHTVPLACAAVLAVGAVVTTWMSTPLHQNAAGRRFVASATSAVEHNPTMVLFDGGVPEEVMSPLFGPDSRVSRVIGITRPHPRFDQPTEALLELDPGGIPRPVSLQYTTRGVAGSVKDCGYAVGGQPTQVNLESRVTGTHLVARLAYYTGKPGDGLISIGPETRIVHFVSGGVRALYLVVDGPFSSFTLITTENNVVCLTAADVGVPVPTAG